MTTPRHSRSVCLQVLATLLLACVAACGGGSSGGKPAPPPLSVTTTSLPAATANSAYSASLSATGGTAPYTWTVTMGTLPTGISLSAMGSLSGEPVAGGTSTVTIQVTDAGSPAQTKTQALTLDVSVAPLGIATTALAGAAVNTAYTNQLAASGGAGAYAWTLQSGALPAGLALSAKGALSGSPTAAGIYTFTVAAADSSSPPLSATRAFNLIVAAAGAATQVQLAATPSSIMLGSNFAGFSYEKNKLSTGFFNPGNAGLIALFTRLGPSLLRIGGNSVDDTQWNATGPGETAHSTAPSDIDRLAGLLKASNWQVLYGLPFLNEQTTPVSLTDPALVGAEAVYAMQSLGDRLYGFELGNEPDLYKNQITGFTYVNFQSQWETYRTAILTAVAAAKTAGTLPQNATPRFTGPAAAYDQSGFVAPFADAEAADIFLLTRHYYVANGQSPTSTMTLLLTPDPSLPPDLTAMQSSATGNHIASGYRLSEANSFYNGGAPGVSDGFGTSLWAINFLFTNALGGSGGVNFHGGGDGPGYTPIADSNNVPVEVRPEYYGIYLFSQAANGKILPTTMTPASSFLYAYGVAGTNTTSVVLVNTSATTAANVSIQFPQSVSSATFVALTGPSLTSISGQLLNGATIQPDGTWTAVTPPALPIASASLQVPVPAGSAILLTAH